MKPARFHPEAREEYDHEELWYFERSAEAADRFDDEVNAALKFLIRAARGDRAPVREGAVPRARRYEG